MFKIPTSEKLHQELGHLVTPESDYTALDNYAAKHYLASIATPAMMEGFDMEFLTMWASQAEKDDDFLLERIGSHIMYTLGDDIVSIIQEYAAELHAEELRERGLHVPTNQERAADDAGVPTRGEF